VTENLEKLSDEQLEQMLLDASALSGRAAMARVTAVRTILRRRASASSGDAEADARRALELVNATRSPDRQLTQIHPAWVASILTEPEWAPLYVSDEEMRRAAESRASRTNNRRNRR
jgi:hypothetical protein